MVRWEITGYHLFRMPVSTHPAGLIFLMTDLFLASDQATSEILICVGNRNNQRTSVWTRHFLREDFNYLWTPTATTQKTCCSITLSHITPGTPANFRTS